jgi:hypothetical protein
MKGPEPHFIEDGKVIEKTLKCLEAWEIKARSLLRAKTSSVAIYVDDSDSQVPFSVPSFYPDPEYLVDS